MAKPIFPLNPVDGQRYVDQYNILWVYQVSEDSWVWIGPIVNFPVARSGDNCIG